MREVRKKAKKSTRSSNGKSFMKIPLSQNLSMFTFFAKVQVKRRNRERIAKNLRKI